jgi:hypothetical protein
MNYWRVLEEIRDVFETLMTNPVLIQFRELLPDTHVDPSWPGSHSSFQLTAARTKILGNFQMK